MPSDARLGRTLGDYTIESMIGRGGMSVVYLARHTKLERHVALKVMAEELSENEGFRTRFVREAKMATNLEHPNIVPVYDAGEIDGVLYLAPGGTHFGYVERLDTVSGAMAFDLACFYTGEEANQQAARRGDEVPVPNDVYIVNQNTTIRNLTVDPSVKLKLLDWNRCCDPRPGADLDAFASALGNEQFVEIDGRSYARSLSPYWVTIEDGIVTRIEEQFLP